MAFLCVIALCWTKHSSLPEWGTSCRVPVVQLYGEGPASKVDIAAVACAGLGLHLSPMSADALPVASGEIEVLARLWEREAALSGSALLLDCDHLDMADAARTVAVTRLVQQMNSPLIVTSRERYRLPQRQFRSVIVYEVRKPSMSEQRTLWQGTLDPVNLNGHVEALVSQFNLSASAIHAASAEALGTTREMLSITNNRAIASCYHRR